MFFWIPQVKLPILRSSRHCTENILNKILLASQLRSFRISQGYDAEQVLQMSDDEIIDEITGRCGWCGARHVEGEKLDLLIVTSLNERHFRALWNDFNKVVCPKC